MNERIRECSQVLPAEVLQAMCILHLAQSHYIHAFPLAYINYGAGYLFALMVIAAFIPVTDTILRIFAIVMHAVSFAIEEVLHVV